METVMSVNTVNNLTTDLARAHEIMVEVNPKAERLLVVKEFTAPETTDQEREDFTFTYTPGVVRRGFRQMALRMEKAGRTDDAEVFWALRDDIDPYDGWFTRVGEDAA
jgi:hypothetical protein